MYIQLKSGVSPSTVEEERVISTNIPTNTFEYVESMVMLNTGISTQNRIIQHKGQTQSKKQCSLDV